MREDSATTLRGSRWLVLGIVLSMVGIIAAGGLLALNETRVIKLHHADWVAGVAFLFCAPCSLLGFCFAVVAFGQKLNGKTVFGLLLALLSIGLSGLALLLAIGMGLASVPI